MNYYWMFLSGQFELVDWSAPCAWLNVPIAAFSMATIIFAAFCLFMYGIEDAVRYMRGVAPFAGRR